MYGITQRLGYSIPNSEGGRYNKASLVICIGMGVYKEMRIRNFRPEDSLSLYDVYVAAAEHDGQSVQSAEEFETWLYDPQIEALANLLVITDDDDELQTWGQAGTLEGIEGEIIGFTLVQLRADPDAYHLWCQGTVHPQHRRRNAGRALLICALNRAHFIASEFEFEALDEGKPVYFEALLPIKDPASERLAQKSEMHKTEEIVQGTMQVYRQTL